MQFAWLIQGLRTGILTTRYPREREARPAGFRGHPVLDPSRCGATEGCDACVRSCLPGAIQLVSPINGHGAEIQVNYGTCIVCGLCVAACPNQAMTMSTGDELAARYSKDLIFTAKLEPGGNEL